MTWEVGVCAVRHVPRGSNVGYGTCPMPRDSVIATIPVGYADGYHRTLSRKGLVEVKGALCPVVGRVMMDMVCVDVTDLEEEVKEGERVRLLSAAIPGERLAALAGTIPYELFIAIGTAYQRHFSSAPPRGE